MDNIRNSYVTRSGYPGSLALTVFWIAAAIFVFGGAAFSDGHLQFGLLVLAGVATFFGIASALLWWQSRARSLDES